MNEAEQVTMLWNLGVQVRTGHITAREAEEFLRERLSPDRLASVLRAGLPEHKPGCARIHPPGAPCYPLPGGHAIQVPEREEPIGFVRTAVPPAGAWQVPPGVVTTDVYRAAGVARPAPQPAAPAGRTLTDPPYTSRGPCSGCGMEDEPLDGHLRCRWCRELADLKHVPLIVSHHELRMPWPLAGRTFLSRFWPVLALLVIGVVIGYAVR
jgi:hypothetical protein